MFGFRNLLQKKLQKQLAPFYSRNDIKKATEYYVPTQCQNIAPSKEHEPGHTHAFATKESLIPFFMDKVFNNKSQTDRFFIIMADSGMGKTTFMVNLYASYVRKNGADNIELIPLGYPDALAEIDKIQPQKRNKIILLLDAFDEDNHAIEDYQSRLKLILQKAHDFKEIIITCRTQFFPSEVEEPKETGVLKFGDDGGEYVFRKLYISPFDDLDIKKYLKKKYPFFRKKKQQKAEEIVKQSPNLMVRPMLLSYIDDLIESDQKYERTYQIYQELIKKWIHREVQRRPKGKQEYQEQLYKFSRVVANNIYENHKAREGFFIEGKDVLQFARQQDVDLQELELKSRSLLNRDVQGRYKFSHKSILEYFLALEAFENPSFIKDGNFDGIEQTEAFLQEMYYDKARQLEGEFRLSTNVTNQSFGELKLSDMKNVVYISIKKIDSGVLEVLKGFTNLEILSLYNVSIMQNKLKSFLYNAELSITRKYLIDASFVQDLTHLEKVDLSHNQITDTIIFEKMRDLRKLNLNNNKVCNIRTLGTLTHITELNLNNNRIEDVSPLQNLSKLQSLKLQNNKITSIEVLKGFDQLTTLDISENDLDQQDVEALQAALPHCKITFY
jgi:hypothetical protein